MALRGQGGVGEGGGRVSGCVRGGGGGFDVFDNEGVTFFGVALFWGGVLVGVGWCG